MSFDLIIKGGKVVTAGDIFEADIGIKDGKIAAISKDLQDADEIIVASGKLVMPGMIDGHTHMDMPFMGTFSSDDFETGTRAAAFGGVTTIINFAIQEKGKSLKDAIETEYAKAKGKSFIDYAFHVAVTDMREDVLAEIPEVMKDGITSFKLFMTYESLMVTDDVLLEVLEVVSKNGGLVGVHAENYYMIKFLTKRLLAEGKTAPIYHAYSRPNCCEEEAVGRAALITKLIGGRLYIVHLSTAEGLSRIEEAQNEGVRVYAETCPQYLLLDESLYNEPDFGGAKYVMSPPLRKEKDRVALWNGLRKGTIQLVGSDHCPFNMKDQKIMGKDDFTKIPNGAPGVETSLPLLYSEGVAKGRISINRLVEVFSTNPAKLYGLYPKKGCIAVGSDADIVILDPEKEVTLSVDTLHHNVDYTPYEGWKVKGYPVTTIVRGKIVCNDGEFFGEKGYGEFLPRGVAMDLW